MILFIYDYNYPYMNPYLASPERVSRWILVAIRSMGYFNISGWINDSIVIMVNTLVVDSAD